MAGTESPLSLTSVDLLPIVRGYIINASLSLIGFNVSDEYGDLNPWVRIRQTGDDGAGGIQLQLIIKAAKLKDAREAFVQVDRLLNKKAPAFEEGVTCSWCERAPGFPFDGPELDSGEATVVSMYQFEIENILTPEPPS